MEHKVKSSFCNLYIKKKKNYSWRQIIFLLTLEVLLEVLKHPISTASSYVIKGSTWAYILKSCQILGFKIKFSNSAFASI